jgi:hypothetical protein
MKHLASVPLMVKRMIVPACVALTLIGGTAAAVAATASPATGATTTGATATGATTTGATTTKAPAKTAPLTWHPLTLINGWKSASVKNLVRGTPAWALGGGVVYLRGGIEQPVPSSAPFAVLPKPARPTRNLYIEVQTAGEVPGILYVGADGTMWAYSGNATGLTSLAAVSYPAATMKSAKLGLEHGWASSQSIYGTGDPSYAISAGVVYLSGSLHSTGTSHVAALLPKAARPAQQLFIQVYEYGGSTGWLQILPTGQVEVFGSEASLYTSLAGVSYPTASAKWHTFALESDWTSGAKKFHTAAPEYTVIGGVVYLNGSMYETKYVDGLWTDLPAAARTKADVLSIEVDVAGGNAGELGITDSLGLIASQPDTRAQAFTALAGIAYPQSS